MSISSPQKSASSRPSLTEGPDFASWSQIVLAKFAQEAYDKMREQEDEILHLRQDLKMALNVYRELIRK